MTSPASSTNKFFQHVWPTSQIINYAQKALPIAVGSAVGAAFGYYCPGPGKTQYSNAVYCALFPAVHTVSTHIFKVISQEANCKNPDQQRARALLRTSIQLYTMRFLTAMTYNGLARSLGQELLDSSTILNEQWEFLKNSSYYLGAAGMSIIAIYTTAQAYFPSLLQPPLSIENGKERLDLKTV